MGLGLGFQGHDAVLAGELAQLRELGDRLLVVGLGRGEAGLEGLERLDGVLQRKAGQGGAQRAPAHDDEGGGLDQGADVAALHDHAEQDQADAEDWAEYGCYIQDVAPTGNARARQPASLWQSGMCNDNNTTVINVPAEPPSGPSEGRQLEVKLHRFPEFPAAGLERFPGFKSFAGHGTRVRSASRGRPPRRHPGRPGEGPARARRPPGHGQVHPGAPFPARDPRPHPGAPAPAHRGAQPGPEGGRGDGRARGRDGRLPGPLRRQVRRGDPHPVPDLRRVLPAAPVGSLPAGGGRGDPGRVPRAHPGGRRHLGLAQGPAGDGPPRSAPRRHVRHPGDGGAGAIPLAAARRGPGAAHPRQGLSGGGAAPDALHPRAARQPDAEGPEAPPGPGPVGIGAGLHARPGRRSAGSWRPSIPCAARRAWGSSSCTGPWMRRPSSAPSARPPAAPA